MVSAAKFLALTNGFALINQSYPRIDTGKQLTTSKLNFAVNLSRRTCTKVPLKQESLQYKGKKQLSLHYLKQMPFQQMSQSWLLITLK